MSSIQPRSPASDGRVNYQTLSLPLSFESVQQHPQNMLTMDMHGEAKESTGIRKREPRQRPCFHYMNNRCSWGDKCKFSHSEDLVEQCKGSLEEMHRLSGYGKKSGQAPYRTVICRFHQQQPGSCSKGDFCNYAHGPEQLVPVSRVSPPSGPSTAPSVQLPPSMALSYIPVPFIPMPMNYSSAPSSEGDAAAGQNGQPQGQRQGPSQQQQGEAMLQLGQQMFPFMLSAGNWAQPQGQRQGESRDGERSHSISFPVPVPTPGPLAHSRSEPTQPTQALSFPMNLQHLNQLAMSMGFAALPNPQGQGQSQGQARQHSSSNAGNGPTSVQERSMSVSSTHPSPMPQTLPQSMSPFTYVKAVTKEELMAAQPQYYED